VVTVERNNYMLRMSKDVDSVDHSYFEGIHLRHCETKRLANGKWPDFCTCHGYLLVDL
jgi:hypothetical protein